MTARKLALLTAIFLAGAIPVTAGAAAAAAKHTSQSVESASAKYRPDVHGPRFHYRHGAYRFHHQGYWYAYPWWTAVKHRHGPYRYYYGGYWYPEPWWTATILPVLPPLAMHGAHASWCWNHGWYDPATGMCIGHDGS